jgi:hypothetical protein
MQFPELFHELRPALPENDDELLSLTLIALFGASISLLFEKPNQAL